MDWNALIGALIGAGVPSAAVAYLTLRRGRQATNAATFGPAVLLLVRIDPLRVTINANAATNAATWTELEDQLDKAREGLLIVSAGHPSGRVRQLAAAAEVRLTTAFNHSKWAVADVLSHRDNPEWMKTAEKSHATAAATVQDLIRANFAHWPWRRKNPEVPPPGRRAVPAPDQRAPQLPPDSGSN